MARNSPRLDWAENGKSLSIFSMDSQLNLILKGTSRAFYLSLAALPAAAREPLSLGYLLARAADTVADAPAPESVDRTVALLSLREALTQGEGAGWQAPNELVPEVEKERELLRSVPQLLALLKSRSPEERRAIQDVVSTLIEGMLWDQAKFSQGASPGQQGLSREDLETYTYLVAGCVGPFWSWVCATSDPRLQVLLSPGVREMSIEFGKGLQWVNILRDAPKDQSNGRNYLAALGTEDSRLTFPGQAARALFALATASRYPTLFPRTALGHRLAVFWPLAIGFRTLEKLFSDGGPRLDHRVKVARWEVLVWVFLGPLFVLSNWGLERVLSGLRDRAESALKSLEERYEKTSF